MIFVNEKRVDEKELEVSLVAEALASRAEGAGLTGGDPLARPRRALAIIRRLKLTFGEEFHVHLYTSGVTLSEKLIKELISAGLDELRLHPPRRALDKVLKLASKFSRDLDIGLELPALPGHEDSLLKLLPLLEESGVKFLNLNELEFSESNYHALLARGYEIAGDMISAKGSRETALKVINAAGEMRTGVAVHFCPATSKDRYQTGLRLYRRGLSVSRAYEYVSDYGTLLYVKGRELRVKLPHALYGKVGESVLTSPFLRDYVENPRIVEVLASADRLHVYEE